MSDNDKPNPAELAGAYALDALTPAEAAEFEAFLETSEEARVEAAELSDTAVGLGLATAPVQPSPALKANLMAQLASTPQLPPLRRPAERTDADVAHPRSGNDAPTPDAEANETTAGATGAPASGATATPGGGGPAEERAQLRWFQRPVVLITSAAAAIALFFGGLIVGQLIDTNTFEREQAAALADINAAPDTQRASTTTSDGQPATLVWSGELGLSALLIEDLPPLPEGRDYQLWYMNEGGAFSAGTFDSAGDGTVWRVLEGTMKAGDQVGVTVEPDGGSAEPTTDPIVAIQS